MKAENCPPNTVPYCMSGWFTPLCDCTTEQSRQTNALRPLPILTSETLLQSESCIRDLLTSNDPLLIEIALLAQRITNAVLAGNAIEYSIAEKLLAEKILLLPAMQSHNFQQITKRIILQQQGKRNRNFVAVDSAKKLMVYPNPFSRHTEIGLPNNHNVPNGMMLSVVIYNQFGQIIKRITTKSHQPIQWDATDETGITVANGIYMVKLTAGTQLFTQQIILSR